MLTILKSGAIAGIDGFIIDVLDLEWNFLERVNLDIRPVFEFWWIHKKLFLS